MAQLEWDKTGERYYETGVKKVVLYPQANGAYPKGVAWNGVTAIADSPSGAEATALYADDIKYLNLMSNEEYNGSITAYTYPDEFGECDGSIEAADGLTIGQQSRKAFGYSWVTTLGNDTEGTAYGYKIHIVYNALASPSEKSFGTINDSPEAVEFSWDISTTPVEVTGHKPTAKLVIDSTKVESIKLAALEKVLYGSEDTEAKLPLPDEIIAMLKITE